MIQAAALAFDGDSVLLDFRSCPATGLNNPKHDNSILQQMVNSGKMIKAAAGNIHNRTIASSIPIMATSINTIHP